MNIKEQREIIHYTYIMLIDDNYFYIGQGSCNCGEKNLKHRIYINSGNQMMKAYNRRIITYNEYRERCPIIEIETFATRDESLDREEQLIAKFKHLHGDRCLNIATGNRHRGAKREYRHSYPHLNGEPIKSKRKEKIA